MGGVDLTSNLTMEGMANVTPLHGQIRRAHAVPLQAGVGKAEGTATAGQSALTTARSNLPQVTVSPFLRQPRLPDGKV